VAVGAVASNATPVPVASREIVSPSALKLMFALETTGCVGVKRTVMLCGAPRPDRMNGLPDATLKGADTDTVPDTVPPRVFDRVNVWLAKLPTLTLPNVTLPPGLTAKSICATALAVGEHTLSLPRESTAVTETR
jgi:hypothetical protein